MKGRRNTIVAYWVAVGFGAGHVPFIAGTIGTVPFWLVLFAVSQWRPWSIVALSCVSLFVAVVGIWAATRAERRMAVHDPKQIVIDEWAGMAISLIGVPPRFSSYLWAFLLFRFYDVIKPVPARQMERLPGGYGIVLDDVIAGLYALVSFHLLHSVWPRVF
jgi:phosphatidylglycerophosphatase A